MNLVVTSFMDLTINFCEVKGIFLTSMQILTLDLRKYFPDNSRIMTFQEKPTPH